MIIRRPLDLSSELKHLIFQQYSNLFRMAYLYKVNRRHCLNTWKEYKINPLPDKNYKLITVRLFNKEKELYSNIKNTAESLISAREQLKEIESKK